MGHHGGKCCMVWVALARQQQSFVFQPAKQLKEALKPPPQDLPSFFLKINNLSYDLALLQEQLVPQKEQPS
jgi:hypothetical protein